MIKCWRGERDAAALLCDVEGVMWNSCREQVFYYFCRKENRELIWVHLTDWHHKPEQSGEWIMLEEGDRSCFIYCPLFSFQLSVIQKYYSCSEIKERAPTKTMTNIQMIFRIRLLLSCWQYTGERSWLLPGPRYYNSNIITIHTQTEQRADQSKKCNGCDGLVFWFCLGRDVGPLDTEYIMMLAVMTLYHYILQLFDHQPSVNSPCSHQNNITNSNEARSVLDHDWCLRPAPVSQYQWWCAPTVTAHGHWSAISQMAPGAKSLSD